MWPNIMRVPPTVKQNYYLGNTLKNLRKSMGKLRIPNLPARTRDSAKKDCHTVMHNGVAIRIFILASATRPTGGKY